MALATLCAALRRAPSFSAPECIAFVVDHKLRDRSTDEARRTLITLRQMRVDARLLTLDWTERDRADCVINMESTARRLRYQALGKACRDADVRHLLVAHHQDDQAETVLVRLANAYYGAGLIGMRSHAPIPDCEGIYGVHQPGLQSTLKPEDTHREELSAAGFELSPLLSEGGGVSIVRPLLAVRKQQLVATCEQGNIPWIEDHTNADRNLTLRNTVRSLLLDGKLPIALRRPRLLALAECIRRREESHRAKARTLFERAKVQLTLESGMVYCHIPNDAFARTENTDERESASVGVIFLYHLLQLVSPLHLIDRSAVYSAAVDLYHFFSSSSSDHLKLAVAGVSITARRVSSAEPRLVLHRQVPPRSACTMYNINFNLAGSANISAATVQWSEWQLWDNRYWIRLGAAPFINKHSATFQVRFLTEETLAAFREQISPDTRKVLDNRLKVAPEDIRFTLPAVFVTSSVPEQLVALPSINLFWGGCRAPPSVDTAKSDARWYCDVKYKRVDGSMTEFARA